MTQQMEKGGERVVRFEKRSGLGTEFVRVPAESTDQGSDSLADLAETHEAQTNQTEQGAEPARQDIKMERVYFPGRSGGRVFVDVPKVVKAPEADSK